METNKLGAFIILMIGVIVCLALLFPIADRVKEMTDKYQVTNESLNLHTAAARNNSSINLTYEHEVAHVPTGWNRAKCPLSNVFVGNESKNYTVTTDYTINATHGFVKFLNTSVVWYGGNDTAIDYKWCGEGYVTGATSTMVKLILIFAGLGILGFAIYYGIREWIQ